ncbi:hypothetical protein Sfum_2225 [Syntrophobacter fumaroxidans MPOB]|uniref:Uncharacterized protein n=1 Tax=Syntrophobacter fumaroxidans (strain DSM 10017 / MPOB) TaxID=335543 RepID=A0LKF5_SYNFM|nr:hypothetical protein Sfum_2225 [Syntrophobacter fumaroxidans MPOB]
MVVAVDGTEALENLTSTCARKGNLPGDELSADSPLPARDGMRMEAGGSKDRQGTRDCRSGRLEVVAGSSVSGGNGFHVFEASEPSGAFECRGGDEESG